MSISNSDGKGHTHRDLGDKIPRTLREREKVEKRRWRGREEETVI